MVKVSLFNRRKGALLHALQQLDILSQHFRIVRRLGSGSFATVYEVERRSDGGRYALKHVSIEECPPEERTDLVTEIRLLASLDHPGLVRYCEAFVEKSNLFIVTELVPNGDLASLLEKRAEYDDWLPERVVWAYFLQLAVGVQYLHHNHVLHRDLKPQNVLIAGGSLLKIADLGISQMLNYVFTDTLMGTPQYIAPEMWRRQPYSYSADIWALGCILHEMCSLKPLFLAPTDKEIRQKVLSGLLASIPNRYSIDLWDLIRLMLSPIPKERPTIDEILAMPSVQERLHMLPEGHLPFLDLSGSKRAAHLHLIRISARFNKWDRLNDLLPPATYPSGPGVVETLQGLPRRNSCPELAEAAQEGASGSGAELGQGGGSGGGRGSGGSGRGSGGSGSGSGSGSASASDSCAQGANLSRISKITILPLPASSSAHSSGSGAGAVHDRLARKSVAVGQLLHGLSKQRAAGEEGGPASGPRALRRSSSDTELQLTAWRQGRREQLLCSSSSSSSSSSNLLWPSMRPVQFGAGSRPVSSAGGPTAPPALGEGRVWGGSAFGGQAHPLRPASNSPAGAGAASPTARPAAAPPAAVPAAAVNSSSAAGGWGTEGGGASGGGGGSCSTGSGAPDQHLDLSLHAKGTVAPFTDWSTHGGAGTPGSPRAVLARRDLSGHGSGGALTSLEAVGDSAGAGQPSVLKQAGGPAKKASGKATFGSRLKRLAFGDDLGGGAGMHQPLW